MKARVAIVSSGKGVIVKGIERSLKAAGVGVNLVESEVDSVRTVLNDTDIFILYLAEGISEVASCVQLIKEVSDNTGKTVMVVGPKSEWNELRDYEPGLDVEAWYDKMLDMEEFAKYIKEYLKAFDAGETKKHILLVNDDTAYANTVKGWLSGKYCVEIVTTGSKAVEYLKKNPVNLVLLDYELPEMSGVEVYQTMREEPKMKGVPFVFLTSADDKQTFITIMQLNPKGYILKSTTREDLLRRLVQFFRG